MDSGYQELSNQFLQAAKLGKSRAISALIKFDRTLIDSIDQNNSNALMLAEGNGHVNTVELLIRLGVKKDTVNNDLDTALIIASRAGYAEIVQIFIRYCPDRAIQNKANFPVGLDVIFDIIIKKMSILRIFCLDARYSKW